MTKARWEHFHHEADIGVRGIGRSREEAFEQAALALIAVISDPDRIAEVEAVEVRVTAPDDDLLLFEWLNALIYEIGTRRMLFGRFAVRIDDGVLKARLWGEPIDRRKHQPAVEVKGATFTELAVLRGEKDLWSAQCVIDV